MTADDFRTLLNWLYGHSFTAPAREDTRLDERGLRRMATGRAPIPPAVAAYLVGRAALRLTLKGWACQPPPVSAECTARILDRCNEEKRHAQAD